MRSVYDRTYEVRYNAESRTLVYLGPDGRQRPLKLSDLLTAEGGTVNVTIYDTAGNPIDSVQSNGIRALAESDDRTHRSLERIELLLIRLLAAFERVQPEDISPDPRE